jgi:hypothetical protein
MPVLGAPFKNCSTSDWTVVPSVPAELLSGTGFVLQRTETFVPTRLGLLSNQGINGEWPVAENTLALKRTVIPTGAKRSGGTCCSASILRAVLLVTSLRDKPRFGNLSSLQLRTGC